MTTWTCTQVGSTFPVPFATWCSAACGSSPRAQRWYLTRGSRPSGGNGRWAPGGPAPPQWSRSPARWGSGYAPSAPTLQKRTWSDMLLNYKSSGWTNVRCSECLSSNWEKRFQTLFRFDKSAADMWTNENVGTSALSLFTDWWKQYRLPCSSIIICWETLDPDIPNATRHKASTQAPHDTSTTRQNWLSSHWVLPHHSNSKNIARSFKSRPGLKMSQI